MFTTSIKLGEKSFKFPFFLKIYIQSLYLHTCVKHLIALQPAPGVLRHSVLPSELFGHATRFEVDEETMIAHARVCLVHAPHIDVVHNLHVNQKCYFHVRSEHMMYKVNCTMQCCVIGRLRILAVQTQ